MEFNGIQSVFQKFNQVLLKSIELLLFFFSFLLFFFCSWKMQSAQGEDEEHSFGWVHQETLRRCGN